VKNPKFALITSFLGRTTDRFHTYNDPKTLEEKFASVRKIEGMSGVEIVYPYEASDPGETAALLDKYDLQVAAVNVNVKAEPEFRNGGLTSPDKKVRQKAVRFIKDAKEYARAAGADKVTCCPLGDGYEHAFQSRYADSWRFLVETLGEAGEYLPEIPLFIEYKSKETRGRCYVDRAAKTLCLLNQIGNDRMGVTLDFGHALLADEHPAEALVLLAESPYPYYVHINDNDGTWDWDYMVGTNHYLAYAEFLYYLQAYDYDDFLTSDTSPTRLDLQGTFEVNTRLTTRLWRKIHQVRPMLDELVGQGDYLKTWRFIEDTFFARP
jgi:xylose isomerase